MNKRKDTEKTPSDYGLWKRVAKTVTPLRQGSAKPVREEFLHMMRVPPAPKPLRNAHDLATLDINQDKKVRRGRVEINAKIDLHDLTRDRAFSALKGAIIRSYNRNLRCLLVITGKGPRLDGVLRTAFPTWIEDHDIRPLIASYAPAHIKHGGSGAWYVFLKTEI